MINQPKQIKIRIEPVFLTILIESQLLMVWDQGKLMCYLT